MALVNPLMPEPSVVWLSEVAGLWDVLQQTPLAVTVAPPSDVTVPPHTDPICVISETGAVVTTGKTACDQKALIARTANAAHLAWLSYPYPWEKAKDCAVSDPVSEEVQ